MYSQQPNVARMQTAGIAGCIHANAIYWYTAQACCIQIVRSLPTEQSKSTVIVVLLGNSLKLFLCIPYKWLRALRPCTCMVHIYTCLRAHYLCALHVTPYRLFHNYRVEYLVNGLSSTRRTRLTTTFQYSTAGLRVLLKCAPLSLCIALLPNRFNFQGSPSTCMYDGIVLVGCC